MRAIAQTVWRTYVPKTIREPINKVRSALIPPTYSDDGLISRHVCDFLRDRNFMAAYDEAKAGALAHPGDIHFRAYVACWAAQTGLRLEGDFVECGVAHGLLSYTICRYLNFSSVNKTFYLCDTYEGIPVATDLTPSERQLAEALNETHYAGDMLGMAKSKFAKFPNVRVVQGIVPQSLQGLKIDKIAYLSIDMNNAAAEIGAINLLWPKIVPGAIILLDDYAYGEEFRNQKNAWDVFAREKGFTILSLPTGQGMIVKM